MIGSHDSFTYMEARSPLVNAFRGLWRTQDKSIEEQFRAGVRFFDIRLFRDGSKWRAAHGLAEFDAAYPTLLRAAKDIAKRCPGCRFQIWLEKGTDEDWELFKSEAEKLKKQYPTALTQLVRKNPEEVWYRSETYPEMEYLAFREWTWKNVLKGLVCSPIRRWAKRHNIMPTAEQRADRGTVYFMDFV